VDIDAADKALDSIKIHAKSTFTRNVLTNIGSFGAGYRLSGWKDPVLISSADGVGTKLKLAFELNRHDTVGIDLVAMSVNDILVQGAEPLFFLDYFACGKLTLDTAEAVIAGIATGCEQAGCALIGGETAEMPGMYPEGEYDLAGFAVGVVEKSKVIGGQGIVAGDVVLGLASSGAHSNGYSLVRKLIDGSGIDLGSDFHGRPFADAVMAPTRIYVKPVLSLLEKLSVKGMAHITGGGITGNLPRCLPEGVAASVDQASWTRPPLFDWLQAAGNVEPAEMLRTFNCGIGLCIVVAASDAAAAMAHLTASGETVWRIGEIVARPDGAEQVVYP
jgi:phosphoribosylformylglycinamidine cyclo-ligase